MFNKIHRIFQFPSFSFELSLSSIYLFHFIRLRISYEKRKREEKFIANFILILIYKLTGWRKRIEAEKRREFQSIFDSFDKHYKSQIIKKPFMYTIARNWEHKRDFLEKFAMPKLSEISQVCCFVKLRIICNNMKWTCLKMQYKRETNSQPL